MSFLKSIVNGMLKESAQAAFITKIHKETGVPVDKLNEAFHAGTSLMTNINNDPIVFGKSSVYRMLDELDEGDVIDFKKAKAKANKEKGNDKPVKHCTCPYDPEDDTKDVGTCPKCPYHGDKVTEDASRQKHTMMVDRIIDLAKDDGMDPEALQKKAERMERFGSDNAGVYMDAAHRYKEMSANNSAAKADTGERMYQIFDIDTKKPVSKPSANVRRLRKAANKRDIEYGAIRYIVKPIN